MIIRRIRTVQSMEVTKPYRDFLAEHACELTSLMGRDGKALIADVVPRECVTQEGVFVTDICFEDSSRLAEYNADWLQEMVGRILECYPEMTGPNPPLKPYAVVFDLESPTNQADFDALLPDPAAFKHIPFAKEPPLKAPGAPGMFGSGSAASSHELASGPSASYSGMQNDGQ